MRLETTPVFTKNYASQKKIKINRGGTRSSKTRSIAQLAVLWLFTGKISRHREIEKGVWSTVRKYSTTLDATVIRDFEEELDKQGLYGAVKHNKTRRTYSYGERMVEFFGADDEKKLRGAKRNILYCNEANELEFKTQFFQLIIRTEDDIFIDFNPDDENVWINTELEQKRQHEMNDVEVIVSTYKDNTFLPASLVKEIEYLEKTDPEFWKIYGLGQYGKVFGQIFENYEIVPEIPKDAKFIANGCDFGFTNDPCAILEVYQQNGELWINQLAYQRGMTNPDIAQRLRELKKDREYTVFDSAEPKSIKELQNLQINAWAAEKGQDSVRNSIDILKRYKMNITANSVDLIREIKTYKWVLDKTANPTQEPIDYNNHCFIGSTLITTHNGLKRIDSIQEGDLVLTSCGYRRVLKRFDNGLKQVNNYLMLFDTKLVSLCSTKEHKIKTITSWEKISQLQSGQTVYLHSHLMDEIISCTPKKGIFQKATSVCTLLFTSSIMVKFLKAFMYTILIQILGITELTTLKLLRGISTYKSMVQKDLKIIMNGLKISILKELRKQRSGTNQQRDCSGTLNTHQECGKEDYPLKKYVDNAKKSMIHISPAEVSFAITTAELRHLEIGESRNELVYDLMVEDCHEYFANGILVHNCIDALRYVALNKLGKNNNGIYHIR